MFLIFRFCKVSVPSGTSRILLVVVSLFFARMITADFNNGNITGLILWMCLESTALLFQKRSKPATASFLLALGINFKLLLLPVVVYWIWRGYWRAALFCVVWFVAFLFIPMLVFGWEENIRLLLQWQSLLTEHSLLDATWSSLLMEMIQRLFGIGVDFDSGSTSDRYSFLGGYQLPISAGGVIFVYATIFFLITFTLFILRKTPPFRPSSQPFPELAYILLVIPFISPHQQIYSLLFGMPLMIYIGSFILKHPAHFYPRMITAIIFSLFLILFCYFPHSKIFSKEIIKLYLVVQVHFFYALYLLFLIPLLVYCQSLLTKNTDDIKKQVFG